MTESHGFSIIIICSFVDLVGIEKQLVLFMRSTTTKASLLLGSQSEASRGEIRHVLRFLAYERTIDDSVQTLNESITHETTQSRRDEVRVRVRGSLVFHMEEPPFAPRNATMPTQEEDTSEEDLKV